MLLYYFFLTLLPGTAKDILALCQHHKYSLLAQTCSNECPPSSPGYLPFYLSIQLFIYLSSISLFIYHYPSIYPLSLIYHPCVYVTILYHLSVYLLVWSAVLEVNINSRTVWWRTVQVWWQQAYYLLLDIWTKIFIGIQYTCRTLHKT